MQVLSGGLEKESQRSRRARRIALFSSGLGHVVRGFEISTARFFRLLQDESDLEVRLYSGGPHEGATRVWNIGRKSWLDGGIGWLPFLEESARWKASYVLEQVTFSIGLAQHALGWQPDIVWTKEVPLGQILWVYRLLTGRNYKIVFANGGGFKPHTYRRFDFIQHLQEDSYVEARAFGILEMKMAVVPNPVPEPVIIADPEQLRRRYGYDDSDWIVVSVAAWNKHHKRIDYLIQEVARIDNPRVKLLLVGEPEPASRELKALGERLLKGRITWMTLPESRVSEALGLADIFVLTSLYEGLGAVLIEAAMAGLPVLCHPHSGGRFILRDDFWMVNMSVEGGLSKRLEEFIRSGAPSSRLLALGEQVRARFGAQAVASEFRAMIRRIEGM